MREITVEAVSNSISQVTAFVDEALERLDCPPKANAQIDICIDEIFGNIANYAYGSGTGSATVRLAFDETGTCQGDGGAGTPYPQHACYRYSSGIREPSSNSWERAMKEIVVDAVTGSIAKVTQFVDEELEQADCPAKANAQIDICIDEIVANIAHYAYDTGAGSITVQLSFDEAGRLFSLTFIDAGKPFDPCNVPEPDTTSPLEERPIGGLGLFMVKNMMDEMSYRREGEHNVLTIAKRI